MNFLLDTHTFLWFCQGSLLLSNVAKSLIETTENRKFVSIVSCWEISIRAGLGKLRLGEPSSKYISTVLAKTNFDLLSISLAHATSVESLPFHHRDPFDRMLAAQALTEKMPILSADAIFENYGVKHLW